MDPVCHTLVGLALAQSGLKRWSARATATLVVAANLPDVDIIAVGLGRNLEFRRGWTHGIVALVVWPLVLAGLVWWWDRWRRSPNDIPARVGRLVLLSAIGVITHPFLDYLNNYGVRWLMPFQDRWYYGDTLFIVDPWLLLILAGGVVAALRRSRLGGGDAGRPARLALAATALYIGLMMLTTSLARRGVASALEGTELAGARFMATAVPVNPFVKEVVVDDGRRYHVGRYRLIGTPSWGAVIDKGAAYAAAADRARRHQPAKAFFHWSRFPVIVPIDSLQLRAYDLRYARPGQSSWAAITFPNAKPPESR